MTSPKELKGRCLLQIGREQLEALEESRAGKESRRLNQTAGGQRVRGREATERKKEREPRGGDQGPKSAWPKWQGFYRNQKLGTE